MKTKFLFLVLSIFFQTLAMEDFDNSDKSDVDDPDPDISHLVVRKTGTCSENPDCRFTTDFGELHLWAQNKKLFDENIKTQFSNAGNMPKLCSKQCNLQYVLKVFKLVRRIKI